MLEHRSRSARRAAEIAAMAVVYFAAARFGLSLAFVAEQVTVVWPPTGLALAAVLVLGPGIWPGIAIGAFAANLVAHASAASAGIAAGNTLEAVIGAALLRQLGFRPSLDRLRDVLALIACAAIGSTLVSATLGVASLCAAGLEPWARFWSLWWIWWLGDGMGALVLAPLLLVWSTLRAEDIARRRTEDALLVLSTLLLCLLVFAGPFAMGLETYPLHYTIFPLVVWAALRFRQLGTTAVTFVVSTVAIWSTAKGLGPFTMPGVHESLILLQLFLAIVVATGLLLGAAITERDAARAQAAAELAAVDVSEQRLRLALDAARMGVWDWDILTGKVRWSDSLEPIHGMPQGSFRGRIEGFQEIVHPEDRARVTEAIRRAIEEGESYDVEFRNVWPDGSVRWMAAKGRVLRDGEGIPVRMIGTGMDVTERRRLQDELRARVEELAEADRRKDEFLAMLAHELRNPLAPLSTSLHLLAAEGAPRERALAIARRQVEHLVRLVDDLLDVSRITGGKIALSKEPVLLEDVVSRALDVVRPLLDGRHTLTVSLPAAPVRLEADVIRLTQVLGNLLSNAVSFTPPGGSVWLTAERAGGLVTIRVRDTGIGLSADLLPRVFDLFVQGDVSLDRARGGLGIGLTLVRALVELHGGEVEARSDGRDQGSEFEVRLPVLSAEPAPAIGPTPLAAPPSRRLRILIVEDDEDAGQSLGSLLELWGHDVRVVTDGFGALRVAEAFAPEVMLSDLGLPGMDGYELARRFRQSPFGQLVLVALSGYGRDEDRLRAFEAGYDHHLVKPPDMDVLASVLGRVAGSG